jgi:DNA-binding PadR family transcriptional regulator
LAVSAKHAVLGLVIERPGYGYELAQRLQERFGAWGWDPTVVYSALGILSRDGHVCEARRERSGHRQSRVVYEATLEGREFFRRWMHQRTPLSPTRQLLDLKIQVAGPEFFKRLIDEMWSQEQQLVDELNELGKETPTVGAVGMESWREAAMVLQRDAEMRLLRVRIEWLQDARRVMKRMHARAEASESR